MMQCPWRPLPTIATLVAKKKHSSDRTSYIPTRYEDEGLEGRDAKWAPHRLVIVYVAHGIEIYDATTGTTSRKEVYRGLRENVTFHTSINSNRPINGRSENASPSRIGRVEDSPGVDALWRDMRCIVQLLVRSPASSSPIPDVVLDCCTTALEIRDQIVSEASCFTSLCR